MRVTKVAIDCDLHLAWRPADRQMEL